jgi:ATP-dependent Lon protease
MSAPFLVLPSRDQILFPGMIRPFLVARPTSVAAIDQHVDHNAPLVIVPQLDPLEDDVATLRLASVGTLARVIQVSEQPDQTARILVEGIGRVVRTSDMTVADGVTVAAFDEPAETTKGKPADRHHIAALARELQQLHREHLTAQGFAPEEQELIQPDPAQPGRVADHVAGSLELSWAERVALLSELDVEARTRLAIDHVAIAIARVRINADINAKVQAAMDQNQKEYHLKEQIKIIRTELGDAAGPEGEADAFEIRLKALDLPDAVRSEALREVARLRRIQSDSAEYNIARTWLETVCDFPWSKVTDDDTSLSRAQSVLEEDHFGLEKVKERIVEYLAVRQLRADARGAILCFLGAPGVGKTSLGKSIARSLGRTFARVSLGGIKDESEIRGHRRTYVGALPGRIVRAMIRAGTRNPVIVLDEIDKVGADFRGDPSSALLEVLDPEQNGAFSDHYMDVPVDLSQVLFIATANVIDPVPAALTDRFEIIEIPGYTEEEKLQIARKFLFPRLAEEHGLALDRVDMPEAVLQKVIQDYTREAGLRNFSRQLAGVFRKVARKVVEGHEGPVAIHEQMLEDFLGPPRYFLDVDDRDEQPGVVIGLAWTATGGDILYIECLKMSGQPGLKLTGSLGDVMKESAEAAMSWLRANSEKLGVTDEDFKALFHLHVPAGAIPKDGPSAGVSMVTTLASRVTGRPVRPRLAMTGEITLRGKVLPVGGVKEKVLAARRAGVREVLLPRHNAKDLVDIPPEVQRDVKFHFVDTVEEVLALALEPAKAPLPTEPPAP